MDATLREHILADIKLVKVMPNVKEFTQALDLFFVKKRMPDSIVFWSILKQNELKKIYYGMKSWSYTLNWYHLIAIAANAKLIEIPIKNKKVGN